MKKLRSFLATLGAIGLASGLSTAYAQEWVEMAPVTPLPEIRQVSADHRGNAPSTAQVVESPPVQAPSVQPFHSPMPQPYETVLPYNPAPGYAADVKEKSFDDLIRDLEKLNSQYADLKKEIAKKSDKADPKKGFTAPKFGGRIFMDSVNVANVDRDGQNFGNGYNYTGFREARLTATGTAYDFLDYKLEIGFENWNGNRGSAGFKDMFLGIKNVPILEYVRIGNQYVEDAGSETCNGTTNYTFMEPPSPSGNQFTSRRIGITSRHLFAQDRGRLFLGVYDATNVSDVHRAVKDSQGYTLNGRLTYAPMYQQDGRCLFLFGGYYNYTDPGSNTLQTKVSPGGWGDVKLDFIDSGAFYASSYQTVGGEAVFQNGGFCVQGEMFLQHYASAYSDNLAQNDDKDAYGGFVMVRQFLTRGDYRKYSKDSACWGAPVVRCPFMTYKRGTFNCIQGPGAWEVAGYYGYYNNDDFVGAAGGDSRWGQDHELGLALNWYWNPQTKWCFNYIHQISDWDYQATNGYKTSSDILGVSCRINF